MQPDRIESIARERFGYEELHPGQREAIEAVVEGRDTLAVMPTVPGKSAIYLISAALFPGPAVVARRSSPCNRTRSSTSKRVVWAGRRL